MVPQGHPCSKVCSGAVLGALAELYGGRMCVMRMHCFVQNGLLGVSEHSGKCVINEEVVPRPAYCSLFC